MFRKFVFFSGVLFICLSNNVYSKVPYRDIERVIKKVNEMTDEIFKYNNIRCKIPEKIKSKYDDYIKSPDLNSLQGILDSAIDAKNLELNFAVRLIELARIHFWTLEKGGYSYSEKANKIQLPVIIYSALSRIEQERQKKIFSIVGQDFPAKEKIGILNYYALKFCSEIEQNLTDDFVNNFVEKVILKTIQKAEDDEHILFGINKILGKVEKKEKSQERRIYLINSLLEQKGKEYYLVGLTKLLKDNKDLKRKVLDKYPENGDIPLKKEFLALANSMQDYEITRELFESKVLKDEQLRNHPEIVHKFIAEACLRFASERIGTYSMPDDVEKKGKILLIYYTRTKLLNFRNNQQAKKFLKKFISLWESFLNNAGGNAPLVFFCFVDSKTSIRWYKVLGNTKPLRLQLKSLKRLFERYPSSDRRRFEIIFNNYRVNREEKKIYKQLPWDMIFKSLYPGTTALKQCQEQCQELISVILGKFSGENNINRLRFLYRCLSRLLFDCPLNSTDTLKKLINNSSGEKKWMGYTLYSFCNITADEKGKLAGKIIEDTGGNYSEYKNVIFVNLLSYLENPEFRTNMITYLRRREEISVPSFFRSVIKKKKEEFLENFSRTEQSEVKKMLDARIKIRGVD